MSIKKISGLLLVMLALVSCKKELEPQESSSTTDSSVVATAENPAMPASPTTAAPAAQPVQMQPTMNQTAANPAMATPVAKGMNPAHGQPGHRCDIAVGAPLNSPPGKTTPQPIQNPPVTMTQSGTGKATITPTQAPSNGAPAILNAPSTVTAPGMNPPHGQPGHKCDVAVGAPLPK